jgi:hypothetical protein
MNFIASISTLDYHRGQRYEAATPSILTPSKVACLLTIKCCFMAHGHFNFL